MPSATSPQKPLPDSQIPNPPPNLSSQLPSLGKPRQHPRKARPTLSNPSTDTPLLPPPPPADTIHYEHPVRRILSPQDHRFFLDSPTHSLILAFAFNIAESVRDRSISSVASEPVHPTVLAVLTLLDQTEDLVRQNPPDDNNGSRFGNPAFRSFIAALTDRCDDWHTELLTLPTTFTSNPTSTNTNTTTATTATPLTELSTYYTSSFGSPLRIDYGSGHELNLLTYLLSLHRLSLLPPTTFPSLALLILPRYLRLMRTLQSTYYLEPAGSHGVWGLDDYHFLPFLFGAAQLANHPFIRPLAIHSQATLDAYGDEFLYLDMVRSVNATKTVKGLRWHSPMLDDISGVKEGWGKVEVGMRRMFVGEVVGKLVVMQHFLFGGLVPAVEGMTEASGQNVGGKEGVVSKDEVVRAEGHEGHAHNSDAWGDCCGIQVPSGVGAAQEMRKRMGGGSGLRPLPFD